MTCSSSLKVSSALIDRASYSSWETPSGSIFNSSFGRNGIDRANIGAGPAQRPDLIRDPNLSRSERQPERWFDTDAFVQPAPFTFGTAGRNVVTGPGLGNLDMSLQRNFEFKEGRRVEL